MKLPGCKTDTSLLFHTAGWMPRLCCIQEPPDSSLYYTGILMCLRSINTEVFGTYPLSMAYIFQYLDEEE